MNYGILGCGCLGDNCEGHKREPEAESKIWKVKRARFGNIRSLLFTIAKSQGDFNCGASSQADFILNYFLSNFLKFSQISTNFPKFLLKFSIGQRIVIVWNIMVLYLLLNLLVSHGLFFVY